VPAELLRSFYGRRHCISRLFHLEQEPPLRFCALEIIATSLNPEIAIALEVIGKEAHDQH
jgi:hypothetical protein